MYYIMQLRDETLIFLLDVQQKFAVFEFLLCCRRITKRNSNWATTIVWMLTCAFANKFIIIIMIVLVNRNLNWNRKRKRKEKENQIFKISLVVNCLSL